jgi:aminoglycoside 6'-N-acetyltransferase I
MIIRELRPDEYDAWLDLRALLWPEQSRADLAHEQAEMQSDPNRNRTFVAVAENGELSGFVEVSIRDWAEGCATRPVGYLEGWYVVPEQRGTGVGRALIRAAEQWAREQGCTELASDADPENELSRRAHTACGFEDVGLVRCFRKSLAIG